MSLHPSTPARPSSEPPAVTEHATQVDLLGTPAAATSARLFVATWCHDRAVDPSVSADLTLLASEAVTQAFWSRPIAASIALAWHDADADLVRLEVRWRCVGRPPHPAMPHWLPAGTIALLDQIAAHWNYDAGATSGLLWVTVDAAPRSPKSENTVPGSPGAGAPASAKLRGRVVEE